VIRSILPQVLGAGSIAPLAHRASAILKDLVDGGIAPGDPRASDVAFMRRMRTLNGAVLGLMVACPITGAIFWLSGAAVSLVPITTIALAAVAICVLVRLGGSLDAATHGVVTAVVALMAYRQAEFGGLEMLGQAWVYLPLMVAGLTLGVRGAAIYTSALSLQIAVFAWLESNGVVFPSPVPPTSRAWYTAAVQILFGWALFVVVYAFLVAQRSAERQLLLANRRLVQSRDRAEEATRAKSQFLANMSHEIRTPMNVIFGMTEMIGEEGGLNPIQRDCLERARNAAKNLLGLVDDILDVSKIEAGKMGLDEGELNLGLLLESVTDLLAPRAAEKGLRLACRVAPELRKPLLGDPLRLRQIVTNLVGNAVKFTDRGEIEISARVVEETSDVASVLIAVKDTGIGIAPDRHVAVFESFTQADGSSTCRHGGTGLGLTICRELVHLMGGSIGLESTPGVGSEFRVGLPLAKPTGAGTAPSTQARPDPERLVEPAPAIAVSGGADVPV
jgi:signal transduction histidine kinase